MSDHNSLPERRLMQAVILTAIADACGTGTSDRRTPATVEADQAAALEWITDAGPDFHGVCELAGLHPLTVRNFALAFIASGKRFPRVNRVNYSRVRNPLSHGSIASRAGVSSAAVRGVLKHDKGSREMKERVRQALEEITEQLAA